MVDKPKEILATVEQDKGKVLLFAVVKMDELTDRWTIILSADWINEESKKEVFRYLLDQVIHNLGEENIQSVARIGVFSPDEHLVQDLLKYKKDTHIAESTRVNGNIVHEAYILESDGEGG